MNPRRRLKLKMAARKARDMKEAPKEPLKAPPKKKVAPKKEAPKKVAPKKAAPQKQSNKKAAKSSKK